MSQQTNGAGRADAAPQRLVVVRVQDAIEPKLTARAGARYQSPPQTHEQAMTLVRLLLGCATDPDGDQKRWSAPIAGGRRLVSLSEEASQ